MNPNSKILHQFIQGLRQDFDPNAESNKSFETGVNGRLYSNNGTLSYSSIEGTVEVLDNDDIVKYMGFWAFIDKLMVIVKKVPGGSFTPPNQGDEELDVLNSESVVVDVAHTDTEKTFEADMQAATTKETFTVPVKSPIVTPTDDYNENYACGQFNGEEIDYTTYFTEYLIANNYEACYFENDQTIPVNNENFTDAIYIIEKDSNGDFTATLIYEGYLNIPINGKVVTYGLNESSSVEKVYFTDFENPFRLVNLKDKLLGDRIASEFNVFQGGVKLSPRINAVNTDGEIPASTVFYSYRLFTDNGQVTQFAPPSRGLVIAKESGNLEFAGGGISEVTDKHVTIQCNIPDFYKFSLIQAVAMEYEGLNALTTIRDLGTKEIQEVNYFEHYGNENSVTDVTPSEILERKASWKYCSGLESKDNILFASGLRNEPLPLEIRNMEKDFALHGWDAAGNTHDCIYNPDPTLYRYFDPQNTDEYYYVNKKRFNFILVFGSYTVRLVNLATGNEYEITISNAIQDYTDQIDEIYDWLQNTVSIDGNFATWFPNLTFDNSDNKLFFLPGDDGIPTDFSDYVLKFDTTQVIQDVDEDIDIINTAIGSSNLIYGNVSLGYNKGNGVKVMYTVEREDVLSAKANDVFPNDEPLLNLTEPSLEKGFMKGEIYRIGMKTFNKEGVEQFVIPFGDIMIPALGDPQMVVDSSNNVITLLIKYRNSYFEGNTMTAERIKLVVRIRLSCEVQKYISSYQIVYVPRDEANRTILCQGISAPLERYNIYTQAQHVTLYDEVANKWLLPFNGGPTYDKRGLWSYDIDPYQEDQNDWTKRVSTHRALFYFDSPDLIYNKISDQFVGNAKVRRVLKVNTDHTPTAIRQSSGEVYPKFSRKIYRNELSGDTNGIPWEMNISVFKSERHGPSDDFDIEGHYMMAPGLIIPGSALNTVQDISNNAMTLGKEQWFFSGYARNSDSCGGEEGATSELWNSNNVSRGYKTLVIKTEEDVFTDSFIDQVPFYCAPEVRDPYTGGSGNPAHDTHGVFNLVLDRKNSIYGGRTREAFTKNFYKPLSDTIPVLETSNSAQEIIVAGDVYTTMYLRTKNDYNGSYPPDFKDMNNSGGCNNADEEEDYTRFGAWCYAVVLETEVEPRLANGHRFYRQGKPFDFGIDINEFMNEAYWQEYEQNAIPKPFLFVDDPNRLNAVSPSNIKVNGDIFDAWTIFPVNNQYELDKDKGPALNLAVDIDKLYAIQGEQTVYLNVNPRTMVPTDQGNIAVRQEGLGDGGPIVDHEIVSRYGTYLRRAVVKSDFGFSFVDENRFEFLQVNKPLFLKNQLVFFLRNLTSRDNPIVDCEGYYDDRHKETNIRVRWKDGSFRTVSYNEAFKVFNGWFELNNIVFMAFEDDILAPVKDTFEGRSDESSLHRFAEGRTLRLFGETKTMKIGITTRLSDEIIAIFKQWSCKTNVKHPVKQITLRTSNNQVRIISGDHHRYQIREGMHSVPLKNRYDFDDLRGQWLYLEAEFDTDIVQKSLDRINVYNFVNFLRMSYQ